MDSLINRWKQQKNLLRGSEQKQSPNKPKSDSQSSSSGSYKLDSKQTQQFSNQKPLKPQASIDDPIDELRKLKKSYASIKEQKLQSGRKNQLATPQKDKQPPNNQQPLFAQYQEEYLAKIVEIVFKNKLLRESEKTLKIKNLLQELIQIVQSQTKQQTDFELQVRELKESNLEQEFDRNLNKLKCSMTINKVEVTNKIIGDLELKLFEAEKQKQQFKQERDHLIQKLDLLSREFEGQKVQIDLIELIKQNQRVLEQNNHHLLAEIQFQKQKYQEQQCLFDAQLNDLTEVIHSLKKQFSRIN